MGGGPGRVKGTLKNQNQHITVVPAISVVQEPSQANNFTLHLKNNSSDPVTDLSIKYEH